MNHRNSSRGAAIITVVLIFLALSALIGSASSRIAIGEADRARTYGQSEQSYYTAESAAEDVVYRLKKGYAVSATESVPVGSTTVTIKSTSANGIQNISATSTKHDAYRSVGISVFRGTGIDFFYGIQTDSLGVTLNSNAVVNGNLFTNGSITGNSNSVVNGDAYAVGTISSPDPTVTGARSGSQVPIGLPEVDIEYWKAQANIHNDPVSGDLNYNSGSVASLGPRRVNGSLNLNSNSILTLTGPLYVTGNLNFNSNTEVYVDESFGSAGTVVVVDGTINFNSSTKIFSTGATPKGYILFLSTKTGTAVNLNSNSLSTLIYAPNGQVVMNSNSKATAVVAKGVTLNSNASINYDEGLADARFSTGPSGGLEFQKWGETQ